MVGKDELWINAENTLTENTLTENTLTESTLTESTLTEGIQVLSAVNRRAEVEGVAGELRRLARDENLRWNEIAIMSRDLAGYD